VRSDNGSACPSAEYVTGGLSSGVVAEVERIATELAALGRDSMKVGRPIDREGGLREFDSLGGRRLHQLPVRTSP
jgi:hypothetical protein